MNSEQILQREYLGVRARLLEVAATMDRIQRGEGQVADSTKLQLINQAIAILGRDQADRAEQIQLLFSRPYRENWTAEFKM
jgi:hypothetical protein